MKIFKVIYLLLGLIIILILAVISAYFYYQSQISPLDLDNKQTKLFIIQEGESTDSISKRLKTEGFIKSDLAFKILARLSNMGGKIQAGDFKISPSMDNLEILNQLSFGVVDKWVRLQEGWRVEEIAQKLNTDLGIDSDEFLKHASEGYMFPDTYLFNKEATALDIATKLKETFAQRYDQSLKDKIKAQGLTEAEGVILASIVEREGRSQVVRTEVASILLRRLNIDMGINADATIQYALGYQPQEKSWWKRNLTRDDLKIDSLYNSYIHKGLPPTPICNPSLSSLKAVAEADPSTPYLYYYHDSQGNSHYGKTLDEHNQNIANNP